MAALGIGIYDRAQQLLSLPYDLSIGVGCSLVRELTQGHTAPQEIMLNRCEPKDPAPYHRLAQCPVRFDQAQCCIILSRQARLQASLGRCRCRDRVRHALRPALLQGRVSLPEVALAVGLHPRSLERHLRDEGASFDALKDEVRFAIAKELLALTSLPVGEIGASLGYGAHSTFVHAFQRWAATTPTKWRQVFASGSNSPA